MIATVAGAAVDARRVVTSEPSHMTSCSTSTELHPVYPSPHAVNPSAAAAAAAAAGIPLSEPQTAFRPVAKRSVISLYGLKRRFQPNATHATNFRISEFTNLRTYAT